MSDAMTLEQLQAITDAAGGEYWQGRGIRMNYVLSAPGPRGTVALIPGLGMQRIEWTAEFVSALQRLGYRTLLADNRDNGATEFVDPEAMEYELTDLADDWIGLVESLELGPVHVVGISMGGMLAQHFALRAPHLTRSLVSLMSTTGRRGVGRPSTEAKWIFKEPFTEGGYEDWLRYCLAHHASIAGARYVDEARASLLAQATWARGVDPSGTARQLGAIQRDGDRSERLGGIVVPTLVVHGSDDPMIDASGGHDTSAAIPGSVLRIAEGLGHTVPVELADELASMLDDHFSTSELEEKSA
ncbi:alpha/beta fold hydrolase [Ruicaihuangia caeni]|uniref:alpha/beta fold hydrolase n=1 Tax=Ruicaihuangia caeni TaxID=3042517 RepID=UPI00338DD523